MRPRLTSLQRLVLSLNLEISSAQDSQLAILICGSFLARVLSSRFLSSYHRATENIIIALRQQQKCRAKFIQAEEAFNCAVDVACVFIICATSAVPLKLKAYYVKEYSL